MGDYDIRNQNLSAAEKDFENALRPLSFKDFSGQKQVVENLEVFVEAAKYRARASTTHYSTDPRDLERRH